MLGGGLKCDLCPEELMDQQDMWGGGRTGDCKINESVAQLKTSREARQTWPCHAHGAVLRSHTESLSDLLRFDQNECDLEHGSYRGWRLQTPGDGNNPSCNKNLSSVMGSTTQTCSDHV